MNTFKLSFKNSDDQQNIEVVSVPDEVTQEQFTKAAEAILSDLDGLTIAPTDEATTMDDDLFISTFLLIMENDSVNVVNAVANQNDYSVEEHANQVAMRLMLSGKKPKGYLSEPERIKKYFAVFADEDKTIPVEQWQAPLFDLQEVPKYYSEPVKQEDTSAGETIH